MLYRCVQYREQGACLSVRVGLSTGLVRSVERIEVDRVEVKCQERCIDFVPIKETGSLPPPEACTRSLIRVSKRAGKREVWNQSSASGTFVQRDGLDSCSPGKMDPDARSTARLSTRGDPRLSGVLQALGRIDCPKEYLEGPCMHGVRRRVSRIARSHEEPRASRRLTNPGSPREYSDVITISLS
jgi:hypothetical protein